MSWNLWSGFDGAELTEADRKQMRWMREEWMDFRETALAIRAAKRFFPYLVAMAGVCVGLGFYLASSGVLAGGS